MTTWDVPAKMLSDRWPTIYWSIWHPNSVSILWWNHVLTVHSKFVIVVNFLEKRGIYSTRFSCRNCPLWFLFLIDISLPILQAGQISSTLHNHSKYTEDDDIISIFNHEKTTTLTNGVRNQFIHRRLQYIFYTNLHHFFLLVWCLSLIECCRMKSEN